MGKLRLIGLLDAALDTSSADPRSPLGLARIVASNSSRRWRGARASTLDGLLWDDPLFTVVCEARYELGGMFP